MYDNKPFHIIIGLINFFLLFLLLGMIGYFVYFGPAETTTKILEVWARVNIFVHQIRL